jgi:hypothetical protein
MDWPTLLPWLDALCGSLCFQEIQDPCMHINIKCCPSQWDTDFDENDEPVADGSIYLIFFANGDSRANRERMKKVREAMEILNLLATVDNNAFVGITSQFMTIDAVDGDDTPRVVCPTWKCHLVGGLPAGDTATQLSVSWAELLGLQGDSWGSPEFRDIMDQLATMSDKSGEWWHSHSVVEWRTKHMAVPIRGLQRNPWGDSEPTSTAEMFARELGRRLDFHVPPVVQLCATSDLSSLLDAWRTQEPELPIHLLENRLTTLKSDFAGPAVVELAAALARTGLTSFKIRLDDRLTERQQWGTAMLNAGILLATVICGRSLCQLPSDAGSAFTRLRKFTDMRAVFPWASERTIGGFYSAIAASAMQSVSSDAYLEDGDEDLEAINGDDVFNDPSDYIQWKWLAYALWSKACSPSVQNIDLATFQLTDDHVSAVEAVLKSVYPDPVATNSDGYSSYGFAELPAGTPFQPLLLDSDDDTTFVLSAEIRCRARYDPATMAAQVHAVIPGFGICQVALGSGVAFVPDHRDISVGGLCSRSLEYFKLFVEYVDTPEVLTNLLSLVGGRLEIFWFRNTGVDSFAVDLSTFSSACPQLEKLTLSKVEVVVSDPSESFRNWGLKTLVIDGVVSDLATCLNDTTFRVARELAEVTVNVPRDWDFDQAREEELLAHNDDFLAVAKDKLPIKSKAAMLSVWTRASAVPHPSAAFEAAHRMDTNMLKLIFGFAATPQQRSVQVTRDAA